MRGLVGMVVDSLCDVLAQACSDVRQADTGREGMYAHQVVLEEVLQLPLGGRICEVSNVKSPALGGARTDSLVLGCGGLLSAGVALGGGSVVVEGGVGQLGGGTVNRSGHFC